MEKIKKRPGRKPNPNKIIRIQASLWLEPHIKEMGVELADSKHLSFSQYMASLIIREHNDNQ